jgi:hypothetical protein
MWRIQGCIWRRSVPSVQFVRLVSSTAEPRTAVDLRTLALFAKSSPVDVASHLAKVPTAIDKAAKLPASLVIDVVLQTHYATIAGAPESLALRHTAMTWLEANCSKLPARDVSRLVSLIAKDPPSSTSRAFIATAASLIQSSDVSVAQCAEIAEAVYDTEHLTADLVSAIASKTAENPNSLTSTQKITILAALGKTKVQNDSLVVRTNVMDTRPVTATLITPAKLHYVLCVYQQSLKSKLSTKCDMLYGSVARHMRMYEAALIAGSKPTPADLASICHQYFAVLKCAPPVAKAGVILPSLCQLARRSLDQETDLSNAAAFVAALHGLGVSLTQPPTADDSLEDFAGVSETAMQQLLQRAFEIIVHQGSALSLVQLAQIAPGLVENGNLAATILDAAPHADYERQSTTLSDDQLLIILRLCTAVLSATPDHSVSGHILLCCCRRIRLHKLNLSQLMLFADAMRFLQHADVPTKTFVQAFITAVNRATEPVPIAVIRYITTTSEVCDRAVLRAIIHNVQRLAPASLQAQVYWLLRDKLVELDVKPSTLHLAAAQDVVAKAVNSPDQVPQLIARLQLVAASAALHQPLSKTFIAAEIAAKCPALSAGLSVAGATQPCEAPIESSASPKADNDAKKKNSLSQAVQTIIDATDATEPTRIDEALAIIQDEVANVRPAQLAAIAPMLQRHRSAATAVLKGFHEAWQGLRLLSMLGPLTQSDLHRILELTTVVEASEDKDLAAALAAVRNAVLNSVKVQELTLTQLLATTDAADLYHGSRRNALRRRITEVTPRLATDDADFALTPRLVALLKGGIQQKERHLVGEMNPDTAPSNEDKRLLRDIADAVARRPSVDDKADAFWWLYESACDLRVKLPDAICTAAAQRDIERHRRGECSAVDLAKVVDDIVRVVAEPNRFRQLPLFQDPVEEVETAAAAVEPPRVATERSVVPSSGTVRADDGADAKASTVEMDGSPEPVVDDATEHSVTVVGDIDPQAMQVEVPTRSELAVATDDHEELPSELKVIVDRFEASKEVDDATIDDLFSLLREVSRSVARSSGAQLAGYLSKIPIARRGAFVATLFQHQPLLSSSPCALADGVVDGLDSLVEEQANRLHAVRFLESLFAAHRDAPIPWESLSSGTAKTAFACVPEETLAALWMQKITPLVPVLQRSSPLLYGAALATAHAAAQLPPPFILETIRVLHRVTNELARFVVAEAKSEPEGEGLAVGAQAPADIAVLDAQMEATRNTTRDATEILFAELKKKASILTARGVMNRISDVPVHVAAWVLDNVSPTLNYDDLQTVLHAVANFDQLPPRDTLKTLAGRLKTLSDDLNGEELASVIPVCAKIAEKEAKESAEVLAKADDLAAQSVSESGAPVSEPQPETADTEEDALLIATQLANTIFSGAIRRALKLDTIADKKTLINFLKLRTNRAVTSLGTLLDPIVTTLVASFSVDDVLEVLHALKEADVITAKQSAALWERAMSQAFSGRPRDEHRKRGAEGRQQQRSANDDDAPAVVLVARAFADVHHLSAQRAAELSARIAEGVVRLEPTGGHSSVSADSALGRRLVHHAHKSLKLKQLENIKAGKGLSPSEILQVMAAATQDSRGIDRGGFAGLVDAYLVTQQTLGGTSGRASSSATASAEDTEFTRFLLSVSRADDWTPQAVAHIRAFFERRLSHFDSRAVCLCLRAIAKTPELRNDYAEALLQRLVEASKHLDGDDVGVGAAALTELRDSGIEGLALALDGLYARFMTLAKSTTPVGLGLKRVTLQRILEAMALLDARDAEVLDIITLCLHRQVNYLDGRQSAAALQHLSTLYAISDPHLLQQLLSNVEHDGNPSFCAQAAVAAADIPLALSHTLERMFIKVMFHREVFMNNKELRKALDRAARQYMERLPTKVVQTFVSKRATASTGLWGGLIE